MTEPRRIPPAPRVTGALIVRDLENAIAAIDVRTPLTNDDAELILRLVRSGLGDIARQVRELDAWRLSGSSLVELEPVLALVDPLR